MFLDNHIKIPYFISTILNNNRFMFVCFFILTFRGYQVQHDVVSLIGVLLKLQRLLKNIISKYVEFVLYILTPRGRVLVCDYTLVGAVI